MEPQWNEWEHLVVTLPKHLFKLSMSNLIAEAVLFKKKKRRLALLRTNSIFHQKSTLSIRNLRIILTIRIYYAHTPFQIIEIIQWNSNQIFNQVPFRIRCLFFFIDTDECNKRSIFLLSIAFMGMRSWEKTKCTEKNKK